MRAGFSANPCSFVKTLWRSFHFRAAKLVRKFQVDNIKPLFKQSPPCSGESIQKLAFPRPVYTWHRVLRTHNSHAISTNFEGVLLKRCNPRCSCSLQIHCFLASNVQAVLCHLRSKCSTHRVVKRLVQLQVLSYLSMVQYYLNSVMVFTRLVRLRMSL